MTVRSAGGGSLSVLVLAEHAEQLARIAAELAGERLVGVTGITDNSHRPAGYAEVVQVRRFATSTEVELAALRLTRHGTPSRVVATGHEVQLRAAGLREHLGVPGLGRTAALRCLDLLAQRDALHDAGVPVVPAREIRFAADLARHAEALGVPVRLRRRRAAGWPATHELSSRADVLAVLRTAADLSGLVVEPALAGDPQRVPLDSELGRAVERVIGAPAGTVTGIAALRLADGRLLVDSVETPDTSS